MLFFLSSQTEYNPKLSDATPTTRVAYVKFMAHAMRRESSADKNDQDNDDDVEGETSAKKVHKSILRSKSKKDTVGNCEFFFNIL